MCTLFTQNFTLIGVHFPQTFQRPPAAKLLIISEKLESVKMVRPFLSPCLAWWAGTSHAAGDGEQSVQCCFVCSSSRVWTVKFVITVSQLSHLSLENVLALLDSWWFTVVLSRSTLSLHHQMAPQQNTEFENSVKIQGFRPLATLWATDQDEI